MGDLKKVGIQAVVDGADTAQQNYEKVTKAAEGYAEVLRKLVPLQAEQALGAIEGAKYADFWKVALEGTRTEYEEFWAKAGQISQETTVKQAQAAAEYTKVWETALKQRDALEQEEVIKSAQRANEYVRFWEEALEKQAKAGSAGIPAGSLFGDPARAAEMQKVQAENARIAAQALADAQNIVNKTTVEGISLTEQATKQLIAQGASAKEVAAALKELGLASTTTGGQQAKLGTETKELVGSHEKLTGSAIASSRAFFALTLASFGLMSITQELKKAFGDDLPPAFERVTSAVQQIASFGSAGAFIGGVPGAIIGGITGAVLALGTAALQIDPQIQQLNQSLNNMSKKDEVIETLARVAGVSKDVAAEWEEAARKNSEFAKTLEELTKKAEPLPPILKALNQAGLELTGTLGGLNEVAGKAGEILNFFGTGVIAGTTGVAKFGQELLAGKNVVDAYNSAVAATANVMKAGLSVTGEVGIATDDVAMLTARALAINADATKEADKLADAQQRLADAYEQAGFALSQLVERTANQYAQAQQQYSNSVADAAQQRSNAIFNAEQTLTNRVADLWLALQDKVVDINQSLSDKIADAASRLSDRLYDIQTQLANRISDIQQQLTDKIDGINLDLANKLADLAHKRELDNDKSNDKIQDAARELARKLWEIERERLESIERLSYDTHNQLMDARTDHDKERILRDAQFEQSQIDQKANDARNDAQFDFASKVAQAEKEKQLAANTYEYEVMLAKRLAAQKIAEAEHAADVQLAQAERQAQQQILIAQREAAQQRLIAEREAQQQLAIAQRRYTEETAQAQRAYAQQVEAARRAEAQRNADAQRSLEQRNAAIAQANELERQQIQHTLELAIRAYQRQIAEIQNLIAAMQVLLALQLQLAGVYKWLAEAGAAATANLFGDWMNNMQKLGGLGMTPAPTPTSGTSGTNNGPIILPFGTPPPVTPASINTSNRNSSNINININDATNPKAVAEAVRKELATVAWR